MRVKLSEELRTELKLALKDFNKKILERVRDLPTVAKLERPFKVERCRRLGYKPKPGYVVVVSRVPRGGRRKPRPSSGRRPKHAGSVLFTPGLSREKIAINRAKRRFPNMRVLGAHKLVEDGRHIWYEIVMVDKTLA